MLGLGPKSLNGDLYITGGVSVTLCKKISQHGRVVLMGTAQQGVTNHINIRSTVRSTCSPVIESGRAGASSGINTSGN